VKFTNGASINFLGVDEGNDRVKLSFGKNYERLSRIKAKYDPHNLFRLNANILPAETNLPELTATL
jgi:Berberine and berberine like